VRKHSNCCLWGLLIFIFISGCSTADNPSTLNPDPGLVVGQNDSWGSRAILGRYHIVMDGPETSPMVVPIRDTDVDKKFLDPVAFSLTCAMLGYEQDPMCPDDWQAGDIEFEIKITNPTDIDYYDIWLGITDGHGGELPDPDGWATPGAFENKLPYIGFATDTPECCLPAGQSDTRIRVWKNPCYNSPILIEVILVGTPGHESETPNVITPDPPLIEIPVQDPPANMNIRAYVNDHQDNAVVTADFAGLGINHVASLFDDGHHGDGEASDDLFATGNLPYISVPNGNYEIWLEAVSPGDIVKVYNRTKVHIGYPDASWSEPVSVDYGGPNHQPGMSHGAFDSTGRLHMAWNFRFNWGGIYVHFFVYRSWFDGELSDSLALNQDFLIDGGDFEYLANPQLIVTPQDDVYVFWHQWDPVRDWDLAMYSAHLSDGVLTSAVRIDGDSPGSICSPQAALCSDGRIFLVAERDRDNEKGICITQTVSGSNNWEPTTLLIPSGTAEIYNLDNPGSFTAGVDDTLLFAFEKYEDPWPDSNIFFTTIDPDTLQYTEPVRVSDPDILEDTERSPSLWLDPSGTIGIAWEGVKYPETLGAVYYDLSFDDGATWGEDILFPTDEILHPIHPLVKPLGSGMWGFVFNYDHKNFFMLTCDGGETFSEPEIIPSIGSMQFPNFTVGDNFETWHTWRSNYTGTDYNIFLSRRYYQ